MYMIFVVHRSAPLMTIMTRPTGKGSAPSQRSKPGACSCIHGEAFTLRRMAQPKPSSGPARNEFQKSLSRRMCAFLQPVRATSSIVCAGVKASIVVVVVLVLALVRDQGEG